MSEFDCHLNRTIHLVLVSWGSSFYSNLRFFIPGMATQTPILKTYNCFSLDRDCVDSNAPKWHWLLIPEAVEHQPVTGKPEGGIVPNREQLERRVQFSWIIGHSFDRTFSTASEWIGLVTGHVWMVTWEMFWMELITRELENISVLWRSLRNHYFRLACVLPVRTVVL